MSTVPIEPLDLKNRKVFFPHLQKTGGTSLRFYLEHHFDHHAVCPIYRMDRLQEAPAASLDQYQFFRGHLFYDFVRQLIGGQLLCFTLLREPVARLISNFDHLKRVWRSIKGYSSHQIQMFHHQTLPEFLEEPLPEILARIQNRQAKMLGKTFDRTQEYNRPIPNKLLYDENFSLESALNNLNCFAFVGVTERFQDSLFLLAYSCGWPPLLNPHRLNVTPNRTSREMLSNDTVEKIIQMSQSDIKLYHHAQNLFKHRYTAMVEALLTRYGSRRHTHLPRPLPPEITYELLEKRFVSLQADKPPIYAVTLEFNEAITGNNFYPVEEHPEHSFYRWTGPARRADLFVKLSPNQDYHLKFSVIAAITPQVLDSLTVLANYQPLSLINSKSKDGSITFEGYLPQKVIAQTGGLLRLTFKVDDTIRPSDLNGNDDNRLLGAALGRVTFQPTDKPWINQTNTMSSLEVNLQPTEKVLFLHIPKTAGTTLAAVLEQHFDYHKIAPFLFPRDLPRIDASNFDQYHYFRGHIDYDVMVKLLEAEPICMTMLRDPVERYISAFAQLQRNGQEALQLNPEQNRPLHIFAQLNLPQFFDNIPPQLLLFKARARNRQTRMITSRYRFKELTEMFAAYSTYDSNSAFFVGEELEIEPEQLLAEAKYRLSNMAFFGLTERFQDSLFLMAFTFGLPPLVDYQKLNVAPSRPRQDNLPPETVQQIRDENQLDLQLYAYAQQLFQQRYETMQRELLARYGQPIHAQLPLPLPQRILVDLLEQHYQWRLRQRTRPTQSINYRFDQAIPGRGWHLPEQHPELGPYRWSGPQKRSTLDFVLSDDRDLRITFSVMAAASQAVLDSLALTANEHPICLTVTREQNGCHAFSGIIPKEAIRCRHVCHFEFEVAEVITPNQLDPNSSDSRQLGIAMNWLKISPLESSNEA